MKRSYWEKIAPSYDDEIFDVLQHDKKAIISKAILKLSSPGKVVADIGCAVGKWLPLLSSNFKKVIAIDISAKNLSIAKKRYAQIRNIEYQRQDMSAKKPLSLRCDLAICINAILSSSLKAREKFFSSLSKMVKKDGHLILVVPSLESWMLVQIVGDRWKIDRTLLNGKTSGARTSKRWKNLQQGNVEIDGVPTKHYTKEELKLLLFAANFSVVQFEKIEYEWKTEFTKPPRWLKDPYPWDWMVVAKRI